MLDYLEERLTRLHVSKKSVLNTKLIAEESLVQLIDNAEDGCVVNISIQSRVMAATVYISVKGKKIDSDLMGFSAVDNDSEPVSEQDLRAMMLRSYSNSFAYNWVDGTNHVMINCGKTQRLFAWQSLIALAAAFILAFPLKYILGSAGVDMLVNRFLYPVQSTMVNLLTLVIAPTLFFSIVSFVSNCTGVSSFGKLSIRIIFGFVVTSIASVFLGYLFFAILRPGTEGLLADLLLYKGQTIEFAGGLQETLANIVPSNIVSPFLNTNVPQLLFMALLCGLAVGRAGRFSVQLRGMADAFDTLFSKVLELISVCIPITAFVSMLTNLLSTGLSTIGSLLHFLLTITLSLLGLVLMYSVLIAVSGLNPLPYLKKYARLVRDSLMEKSSVEAVPATIRCCKNELGISNDICSIAIPLGAVGNMDANCIYLTVSLLFLTRICSMGGMGKGMLPMAIMIILLSLGSPLTPGSIILTLTMLASYSGISVAAVSLLFGFNAFVELFLSVCNSAGDVAVALIVAKNQKKLDLDTYYS